MELLCNCVAYTALLSVTLICKWCRLSRDALIEALTTFGEPLSHEELVQCMETLTGSQEVLDVLPEDVTAEDFACGLLGFENTLDSEPIQV